MDSFKGFIKGFTNETPPPATTASVEQVKETKEGEETTSPSSSLFNNTASFFQSVQAKKDNFVNSLSTSIGFTPPPKPNFRQKNDQDESSASEYGDGGDCPNYEIDQKKLESAKSIDSIDSMNEEELSECQNLIGHFISQIKDEGYSMSLGDKEKLKEVLERHTARSTLAKQLRDEFSVNNKDISERLFRNLTDTYEVCLNKCLECDDFSPAVILLQLSIDVHLVKSTLERQSLNSVIREFAIWKSISFWNATFFIAMHKERAILSVVNNEEPSGFSLLKDNSTQGKLKADKARHDQAASKQLERIVSLMHEMGIEKENCLDFLRRQSESVSLPKDMQTSIRRKLESTFE